MVMIDPEQERKRLLDFYSRQMDGRLEQIATQAAGLSELAREVLRQELIRRGLDVELLQPPTAAVELPPEEPSGAEQSFLGEFEKRNLVVIRKFRDLPEALVAQGIIDSAGIETFLFDDATVRMDWFWSNLLGGIKLLVDSENVEAAKEILNQPIPEGFAFEGTGDYQQPRCPKCQSMEISFEELNKLAYGSLFVNLPLPIHRQGWLCHACKHAWRDDELVPNAEST